MSVIARILKKTIYIDECWIFTGAGAGGNQRGDSGGSYGKIRDSDGSLEYVHIVSCREFHGAIPKGYHASHSCRRRRCWNPAHLKAKPAIVNLREAAAVTNFVEEIF